MTQRSPAFVGVWSQRAECIRVRVCAGDAVLRAQVLPTLRHPRATPTRQNVLAEPGSAPPLPSPRAMLAAAASVCCYALCFWPAGVSKIPQIQPKRGLNAA
eukprot:COSAG04_NODE_216_length_19953_cov_85.343558_16_plen_101_part_00